MKFETRLEGSSYRVWDTKDKVWITKACPNKETADEICFDFNQMHRKNFTAIGMPDFSQKAKKLMK